MRLALIVVCVTALAEEFRYPPLALQAKIQGDVVIKVSANEEVVQKGHPLLIPSSLHFLNQLNAKPVEPQKEITVVFHFQVVDFENKVTTTVTKKGDAFDRFILRLLRMKTEKVVREETCIEPTDPPKTHIGRNADNIEVWIYGNARYLQTLPSQLAQR